MLTAILGVLLAGLLVLWGSERLRQGTGLPAGRIIFIDANRLTAVDRTLYDPALGLAGRPDFVLRDHHQIIPVEVKSAPAPAAPYEAHRLQLAAYCRLVEVTYGSRPTHGILRYADRSLAVDYSHALEAELRRLVDQVRVSRSRTPGRSHELPERCRACGFRPHCDESLV